MKLNRRFVEKPWGRTELPPIFDAPSDERIGEVWYTNGEDLPLLAKYIFTSERLSIQVHPNDEQARARGLAQGKSECWYILDAGPAATLGLGLKREVNKYELRAAALDGSIEELINWRPVNSGDFVFVPSGTIHAIGADISLLEFQQNADVTYRLYDYGRPRELHLDDGIAVSNSGPFPNGLVQHLSGTDERLLVASQHFVLLQSTSDALLGQRRWIIPLEAEVQSGTEIAGPGDVLLLEPNDRLESSGGRLLIGATAGPS
ncbi:class I mannose-6-phosphate isomerase [Sphingomonas limnosediminicola]|uniref:Class I mannose-6-phosphate isomerase n=1 Tax=Sphingomonas limnosediminicola TaxID=940133 RepID=A0ABP7KRX6_9SPHN